MSNLRSSHDPLSLAKYVKRQSEDVRLIFDFARIIRRVLRLRSG